MSIHRLTPYELMDGIYARLGQALVEMEGADYKQVVAIIDAVREDISKYTAAEIDNEPAFLSRGALQIVDRARQLTLPGTSASMTLREVGMMLEDMLSGGSAPRHYKEGEEQ